MKTQEFFRKYKEQILYLFFGGLTTVLSVSLFWLLTGPMSMDPLIANVIDWVVCVLFAYLTNRTWVFESSIRGPGGIVKEMSSFFLGRVGTLLMEEIVLWAGISLLKIHPLPVKIAAQVLVVIGNYVISKWFVFRNEDKQA